MPPRIARIIAVLALITVLGGCAPEPQATPSAPPSPRPTFSSEAEAFAAAENTYRAYVDALNQVDLSDPKTFEPVFALTTGELNRDDRRSFAEWHQEGVRLSGKSHISELSRGEVDARAGTWTIEACYDVSSVDVVTRDGLSLVEEDRPDVLVIDVHFVEDPLAADGLLISRILPANEARTCSGS